ncbi:MAG: RNA methyltransferase [Clostridia bacterium]|nr:RNA methyltransferase [Clostridia bacterium]
MLIFKDIISSRNNQLVKCAASLADKKGRNAEKCFIAEGEKLSLEALKRGLPVTHIFIVEDKSDRLLGMLSEFENDERYNECRVILLSESAFSKISTEKAPQGIISVIKYLDFFRNMDIIYKEGFFIQEGERALSLYSLRDPGNLGAVIRSAVAFGVDHIVLSSDSADIYNPKTVRAAMGTMFGVKISYVSDFHSFVHAAIDNGRAVYAAELTDDARSIKDIDLKKEDIFIIGNEGHGIPTEISSICTGSAYIPISEGAESLNASIAASVLMWEQNNI